MILIVAAVPLSWGEAALSLSPSESAWLRAHPVLKVGVYTKDWLPYEGIRKGQAQGFGYDYLKEATDLLGVTLTARPYDDWNVLLEDLCAGKLDVILNVYLTVERTHCLVFTRPYAEVPVALIGRARDEHLADSPDLKGLRVVTERAFATSRAARERYPKAVHLGAADTTDALRMVASGQADAYLGDPYVASALIAEAHLIQVALVRPTDLPISSLHFAVPPRDVALAKALNHALAAIPEARSRDIRTRWLKPLQWKGEGLIFSDEEKAAMAQPLRLGFFTDWSPISFLNEDGQPSGLSGEYLRRFRALGADLVVTDTNNRQDIRERAQRGELDALMGVPMGTPGFGSDWVFSQPFLTVANVIVTRSGGEQVLDPGDLDGQPIALSSPGRLGAPLLVQAPKARIVPVLSARQGLEMLRDGRVDAYVGNLAVVDRLVSEHYAGELQIAAPAGVEDRLVFGVRRSHAPLVVAFDRMLHAQSPSEREAIRSAWLAVEYRSGLQWRSILRWAVPVLLILLTGGLVHGLGHWRLRREVQQRRKIEIQLGKAKATAERAAAAKSDFLAMMSHEIRTPMSGVLGLLDMLARSELDDEQRRVLATIDESTQVLRQILDDILDFSKIEAGALVLEATPMDLRRIVGNVQWMLAPQAAAKGLGFATRIGDGVAAAHAADGVRLRQILFNLASNAVKFTEHGRVEIALDVLESAVVRHSRFRGNDRNFLLADQGGRQRLRFTVTDTGIGISPEQQAGLFQPFVQAENSTTRRFGGTGLGLSICQRLVKMMDGELTLSSAPGQGSRVEVTLVLPLADPASVPVVAVQELAPLPARWRGCRVLVAEDHPVNQALIRWRLRELGLDCVVVADGQAALEALQASHFDLLITDCRMPVMDGYTLARELRRREAEQGAARLPVIALSASVLRAEVDQCLDAGMDDFVAKPVSAATLRDVLARWLPSDDATPMVTTGDDAEAPAFPPELLERFGTREAAVQVAALLVATTREDLAGLRAALAGDDSAALYECLHRIAGSIGMASADDLAEWAHELMRDLERDGLAAHREAVVEYAGEVEAFVAALAGDQGRT